MTALGAALYFGGFGAAALWLYLTGPGRRVIDQGQRPEHSNSMSVSASRRKSKPWARSQSSLK